MKSVIKWSLMLYVLFAVIGKVEEPTDKDYITPEIPYNEDLVNKRYQDSIVDRAIIAKDTTPFKTHWVTDDSHY